MSTPKERGVFALRTAAVLLRKLRHDYERMERDSLDQYGAFDFFVTADHLPDWIYPGRKSENQRRSLRSADWRLLVCHQLANGLKHFEARRATHDSVRGTEFHEGPFSDDFSMDFDRSMLLIHLHSGVSEGHEAIEAGELARWLVDFWEGKLGSLPEASSESSAPPDVRSADSLPK
jgi:hypothetical protein